VYVYDLQETEAGDIAARLVRRSSYKYDDTMNLNLYEQHFSYVSNMEKYSHSYLCNVQSIFLKENEWHQFNYLKSVKYNPFYFPLYST
jgi:hypothetical protein